MTATVWKIIKKPSRQHLTTILL